MLCGIDEAGRGPLAGPVCAAAVILGDNFNRDFLNDSKKLSRAKREELKQQICSGAFAWGVGWASHSEIDSINILQASLLAMKRAFEEMLQSDVFINLLRNTLAKNTGTFNPATQDINIFAVADGVHVPEITEYDGYSVSCTAMIKADAQVPEVMAASILAKTARDNYMDEMALLYPQYGYEKHKGYPTKAHKEAVLKYGASPIQRMSFKY